MAEHLESELGALLGHLDAAWPADPVAWRGWRVEPVSGGANNRLFRARDGAHDYAVKFCVRDERDRAGREYGALRALESMPASYPLAPRAVHLDRDTYRHPVVVQTWLMGDVLTAPPQTQADWCAIVAMHGAIHTVTRAQRSTALLPRSVLYAASVGEAQHMVRQNADRLPSDVIPAGLAALLKRFAAWTPDDWPEPPESICRTDSNWRNFLYTPDGLAAVDWEYSGRCDPAFDMADLITHPAYGDAFQPDWGELISLYSEHVSDTAAPRRIAAYVCAMRLWWAVRWRRMLYEIPRGLDARLVARPETWRDSTERSYARSVESAQAALNQLLSGA